MAAYDRTCIPKPNKGYDHEVARGNVVDTYVNIKFGRNADIGTAFENVNDQGGTYTYSTSVVTYYVSSSSAADTDQVLTVVGIGANNNEVTQTVSLAGQTKTAIGTGLFRVYRVYVSSGSTLAGTLYVYEDDTVTAGVPQTATKIRAKIVIGNNQTQMAQVTVPRNYRFLITDFTFTSGKDKESEFQARIRPSDGSGPWRVVYDHDTYRVPLIVRTEIPYVILENMDIEVLSKVGSGTAPMACNFGYIAEKIDNEQVV